MARPKGSKNRPKHEIQADKARNAGGSGPGPGHNSELTEQELQSRFVMGMAELERLKGEADSANAKLRNERKRIMTYGFTRAQIDFGLELRKVKPDEAIAERRRADMVARFLNHPIGTQMDMFGDAASPDDPMKRAEKAGYTAGLEGAPCKPPMASDSPEGQAWMGKWHEGLAARNTAMNEAVQATEPPAPLVNADAAFDDALPDASSEDDAGDETDADATADVGEGASA